MLKSRKIVKIGLITGKVYYISSCGGGSSILQIAVENIEAPIIPFVH